MGKAIIIPTIDFSSLGMGKVHVGGAIEIDAYNVVLGTSYTPECSDENVTWSIDNNDYAEINFSTGEITIKSNAEGQTIVVTATSISNPENIAVKSIKVFYYTYGAVGFNETKTVDVTSIMRNGSPGNSSNTYRIGTDVTIARDGYDYCLIRTTRENISGCEYYANVDLVTNQAGTTCFQNAIGDNSNTYICELGRLKQYNINYDAPMSHIFPLNEDSSFEYGCDSKNASGQTCNSFGFCIQESNSNAYPPSQALRITDFSNKAIVVHYFK